MRIRSGIAAVAVLVAGFAGVAAAPGGSAGAVALALGDAPLPYPTEMTLAQSDYVEHCGGCHGVQGDAAPANLPSLRGRVGWFMCTPETRAYLLRLPNVARSRITDNDELADLLNFMIFGLGGASTPRDTTPFTGAEVARGRADPFTSVSLVATRARLVDTLVRKCGAPASLRLMYPGQQLH